MTKQKIFVIIVIFMILNAMLLASCTNKETVLDAGTEIETTTISEYNPEKITVREIDLRIDTDMPRISTKGDMLVDGIWIANSEELDIVPSSLEEYDWINSCLIRMLEQDSAIKLQGDVLQWKKEL